MSAPARLIYALIFLICLSILLAAAYVGMQVTAPLAIDGGKIYELKRGQSASDLAAALQRDGALERTRLFNLVANFGGFARNLKAGEYRFKAESSMLDVLDTVAQGKAVPHRITFVEGWTFDEILRHVRTKPNIEQTLAGKSQSEILALLDVPHPHPEGWFFPDTYSYTSGQSDVSLLAVAYEAMLRNLEEEWLDRKSDLPYPDKYAGLIAASIIQKESSVVAEYELVSGVLVNRLRMGMRLQMDPTVIYGLGDAYTGVIKRSQLDLDTPYNTYTRYGLPPTPIAMPGRAALRAAMQPADTSALYFVAKGDGTHHFSDNLQSHLKAVQEYRKLLKRRKQDN